MWYKAGAGLVRYEVGLESPRGPLWYHVNNQASMTSKLVRGSSKTQQKPRRTISRTPYSRRPRGVRALEKWF